MVRRLGRADERYGAVAPFVLRPFTVRQAADAVAALRSGRAGLALIATSVGLVALTAGLGESVATRGIASGGALPPYALSAHPPAAVVVAMLATATLAGGAGSLLLWRAVSGGWTPDPVRLLVGGLLAAGVLLLVPPTASDDLYSYAAYGRMVDLGMNPYTTTPRDLGQDPVGRAVGDPWRDTPTIYGPIATAEQALAVKIAGGRVRTSAALLALASALAFAVTAGLLHHAAADDGTRRRAAMLWTLNPLLLIHLVAGAHLDALLVATALAAVLALRRHPFLAGVLNGAACCVKLTGALTAVAMAWVERRRPARLGRLALGVVLVVLPAYFAVGGLVAFSQVQRASHFVSFASPWRGVAVPLDAAIGHGPSRATVSILSILAIAMFAWLLARGMPTGDKVPRACAVATLAWLLGATYILPWYDSAAWALLALLPASRWDCWLLARTVVLTLAYLPGRSLPMPSPLPGVLGALRGVVAPVLLVALLIIAIRWCRAPNPHEEVAKASTLTQEEPR